MAEDWTPKKLEVLVDVPDALDLEHLRGGGAQPGEALQPEAPQALAANPSTNSSSTAGAPAEPAPAPVEPDADTVAALVGMGFSENGSKRAALATQARTSSCLPISVKDQMSHWVMRLKPNRAQKAQMGFLCR